MLNNQQIFIFPLFSVALSFRHLYVCVHRYPVGSKFVGHKILLDKILLLTTGKAKKLPCSQKHNKCWCSLACSLPSTVHAERGEKSATPVVWGRCVFLIWKWPKTKYFLQIFCWFSKTRDQDSLQWHQQVSFHYSEGACHGQSEFWLLSQWYQTSQKYIWLQTLCFQRFDGI